MTGEWVTLQKSDAEFRTHLLGSTPKNFLAVPVASLNANTEAEQITFKLVPRGQVEGPKWLAILKLDLWIWSLTPFCLFLLHATAQGKVISLRLAGLALLALLALQTSAHLWNEFRDHMVGYDRLYPDWTMKQNHRGWITGSWLRGAAWVSLLIGITAALPLLFEIELNWEWALGMGGITLISLFGYGLSRAGYRFSHWGELFSFLLFGPLLTWALALAVKQPNSSFSVWLGLFSGITALYILQLRNFANILVLSRAEIPNLMTQVGFDRSKKILRNLWLGVLLCAHLSLLAAGYWIWLPAVLVYSIYSSRSLFRGLRAVDSPVGSLVQQWTALAKRKTLMIIVFLLGIFVFEYFAFSFATKVSSDQMPILSPVVRPEVFPANDSPMRLEP